ncbi:MAG: class I SAM-dependent methyltransferase [Corynebacterium sp.]|uniref:class I SAM-dependent methyltransferase n=1 Tax=Corynebacterium sp. TaxID=1720 RepID=UPI0026DBEF82|nr:class I SAM-dependent methyltransferase [Corynebacterium sp.]MDO4761080.1 class I SAM-dependent methyltransferase [Corynebacterium sp.]
MAYHGHNKRADFTKNTTKPIGVITRGTTGFNRLRRCDRWVFHNPELQAAFRTGKPLAIDVGYGASYTTTCEWARFLRKMNPRFEVVGLEIDPERVLPPRDGVRFELGGFELAGYKPQLVRAFNVLRQYDVDQVWDAWDLVRSKIADDGYFVEGTCDEIGRRATWVLLDKSGPRSLTLAWNPWELDKPSDIAERLPKILIHNNIPGHKIYDFLQAADDCWARASGFEAFGPRVRWQEAKQMLRHEFAIDRGGLVRDNRVTIAWDEVY